MHAQARIYLDGMYCRECKDVIALALRNKNGIIHADVSYAKAVADIAYDDTMTDVKQIIETVEKTGYSATENRKVIWKRQIITLVLIAVLVLVFQRLFKHGMGPAMEESMSYGLIFMIGLTTSFHCIGMCGGIMLSQTAVPNNRIMENKTALFVPAAAYNAGRIIAYTLVGAAVGAIGAIISVKASVKGGIFLVIGVLMALKALQMVQIIPRFEKTPFQLPQSCELPRNIRGKYASKPLIIGLLTGLMPCGQLQAMQLYALGTGSFLGGAATMFLFSLGTVPLMLLLGGISTYASKKFHRYMLKISGITISALSILMLLKGLMLSHGM